jgi:arylsulfatase A-like enzyme
MDDLCWGDLACHGNPYTQTPFLDQLYSQSTRLTRYYSGPLCTPARASLMTGRYHLRTRAIDTYIGRSIIDPEEKTLAQILFEAGYETGIFGKWHLGDTYPTRSMDMGFKENLVHRGGGIGQPGDHPDNFGRESYFDPVLCRNGKVEKAKGYCTDIFTEAAMDHIEKNQDRPFFTYLATNAPHSPMQVPDQWWKRFAAMGMSENRSKFYGMVDNIDWNIGRIMKKLEDLKIADNTILIFTSDHGPCPSAQETDAPDGQKIRFNAGLRAEKGTLYNGGIQVPCFWRWPKKFKAATDIDRISNPIDLLPTLAEIAHANIPSSVKLDGISLAPLLSGTCSTNKWPNRTIFMQWHRGNEAVKYRNYAVITQQYKLTRPKEDENDELYNLPFDPGEKTDIATKHPNIVAELRKKYEDWFQDVSSTRPNNYDTVPLVLGDSHENPVLLTRQDWRVHGPDGWFENHYGHWEVNPVREAKYQIRIKFYQPLSSSGKIFFQCGKTRHEANVHPGMQAYEWPSVELKTGRSQLESWMIVDDKKISPLYIWVKLLN